VQSAVESVGIYDTLVSLAGLPRRPSLDELEGLSFAHLVSDGESEAQIASSKAFVQTMHEVPAMGTQFGVRTARWCYNEHYSGPPHVTHSTPAIRHEQLHPRLDQLHGIELLDCRDPTIASRGFLNNLATNHVRPKYDSEIAHLAFLLRTNFKELPPFDLDSFRNQTSWGSGARASVAAVAAHKA